MVLKKINGTVIRENLLDFCEWNWNVYKSPPSWFFFLFSSKNAFMLLLGQLKIFLEMRRKGGGVLKQIPCRTTTHFYIFPSDCCKARIGIFHVCPVCSAKWAWSQQINSWLLFLAVRIKFSTIAGRSKLHISQLNEHLFKIKVHPIIIPPWVYISHSFALILSL